jgi:DNA repair protein RadC
MASLTIHELPEEDRPRERLSKHGAAALSDAELIAIMLRTGLPGCSAIDLGRLLIQRHGSISGLARCSVEELAAIKGVGPAKAVQLAAAFGLASRLARENLSRQRLDSPELIHDLLGVEMKQLTRESLRVVLLDTKYFLLRIQEISLGSLNESIAHPREVLQPAILYSAYAFILVHNHPSGDPMPSDSDRRLTTRLKSAADLLQINMLDHVILGTGDGGRQPYFSFKEAGLLA